MARRMEIMINKRTLHEIISLYAQGYSLREINRRVGIHYSTIKNMLVRLRLYRENKKEIIYNRVCETCHKLFTTNVPMQVYCHNPCKYTDKRQDSGMKYIYISSIRKAFWDSLKSNPEKALELQKQMKKEEGPEFTNMVLDGITNTKEFKHLEKIQKKYKEVFK